MLPYMVPLSVCHVRNCGQLAEDIDAISFAYDSATSLPDRVTIWLTSVNPFLPKFCPKVTKVLPSPTASNPSSKMGVLQLAGPTSLRVLPPGEYIIEYIDKTVFCVRAMSPFAQLLWSLLTVKLYWCTTGLAWWTSELESWWLRWCGHTAYQR